MPTKGSGGPSKEVFNGNSIAERLCDTMRSLTRSILAVSALLTVRMAYADDTTVDSNPLRVDVVVDLTDAGKTLTPPTPEHPIYYYPVVKGYVAGGAVQGNEKTPPPVALVERMAAVSLAKEGYLLAGKTTRPTLLLMFSWGYKAPEMLNDDNDNPMTTRLLSSPGSVVMSGAEAAAMEGLLPTHSSVNGHEMEELVMGTKFDPTPFHQYPNPRQDLAESAARAPRYYFMVSALDFKSAVEQKKFVVLWTARISTELAGHTLDQVLPTLIADGTPAFGRDTNGPHFSEDPIIPAGRVTAGTPVWKPNARQ